LRVTYGNNDRRQKKKKNLSQGTGLESQAALIQLGETQSICSTSKQIQENNSLPLAQQHHQNTSI
jgi:hypothetical protein